MGVIVGFNYAQFTAAYPEFSYLSSDQVQAYWNQATLYQRNDGGGPIAGSGQQSALLNLLAAHLAQLFAPTASGQPAPLTVGRISSATEGSVTVSLDYPNQPASAAFFQQTKYGASWWAATAPFRTMRYLAAPTRVFPAGPWWGGIGWPGR